MSISRSVGDCEAPGMAFEGEDEMNLQLKENDVAV